MQTRLAPAYPNTWRVEVLAAAEAAAAAASEDAGGGSGTVQGTSRLNCGLTQIMVSSLLSFLQSRSPHWQHAALRPCG